MSSEIERLLNQKEVAEMLGMSEAWMEQSRFRKTGVPYIKIGKAVRYRLGDVRSFIESRVQG